MDAIQMIKRGDIAKAAELCFDCISCGLCSIRCPAEIIHYHVFQLVRRLYGKYIAPKAKHLEIRVKEIEEGKFDMELDRLVKMNLTELKKLYDSRDIEEVGG
jgi:heterodisulfide reductase subunit C